ncbi:hypothetical protein NDU88_004335 [Pleurodeles waltl]|uniref:Uncharacterized protein n=1 Tax=Pleurodeles waltl TaxID=8319 RepID=A0AAV7SIG6_PLEWA|nr:hypothetical protein NDU88_004335 [Pleurodeles waltl]
MASAPLHVIWDTYKAWLRGTISSLAVHWARQEKLQQVELEREIARVEEELEADTFSEAGRSAALEHLEELQLKFRTMLEDTVTQQWEASRARNIIHGESCGKLLAWKSRL